MGPSEPHFSCFPIIGSKYDLLSFFPLIGQRPRRGRCPTEHRVCLYVRPYVQTSPLEASSQDSETSSQASEASSQVSEASSQASEGASQASEASSQASEASS